MGRADSPFQDCRALEIGAGETRGQPALDRFSQDLTARARAGEMAHILGRERRRMTRAALRARPDVGKLFYPVDKEPHAQLERKNGVPVGIKMRTPMSLKLTYELGERRDGAENFGRGNNIPPPKS
ncbi:hypothetical protein [Methylosinus sporium]|uniref:Uncharacterized protein n=1 Tax=Methylosinus sporium TaxID=428 RepID=A0A2U1SVX0_METSR|nr:hypothetical protein [Methylosinus sporium]PWB95771.1 hypothetical protein C5689_01330 [Methylosinus sporium]